MAAQHCLQYRSTHSLFLLQQVRDFYFVIAYYTDGFCEATRLSRTDLVSVSFSVLPVQPLTYLPVQMSGNVPAVKVTFLRKKTAEKGSMDGGMLFSSSLVSEEECDEEGLSDYKKSIQLKAWRIAKGQTVSKIFSEKQIVMAFIKGLSEAKGKELLEEGGNVEVESIFHPWM